MSRSSGASPGLMLTFVYQQVLRNFIEKTKSRRGFPIYWFPFSLIYFENMLGAAEEYPLPRSVPSVTYPRYVHLMMGSFIGMYGGRLLVSRAYGPELPRFWMA